MGQLQGKRCIVTGAARGIGRAIGDAYLREGAHVVYVDISPSVIGVGREAVARAGVGGVSSRGLVADVTDRAAIAAVIKAVAQDLGGLDVMVNNAAINKPLNFMDVTEDNWNAIMKINALGVLIGTQEAARQMILQGAGGKIINAASIASRQGWDTNVPYCASKFAVLSLTQSAARALARHRITVNGFAPGVVATELWEQVDKDLMEIGFSQHPGQAMEMFSSSILLGRPARPEDITGTTTFLASPASDYMTGQIVMIDGGMVLV